MKIETDAYEVASRFIGLREVQGIGSNPLILGMLQKVAPWVEDDDVPWCSAFVNFVAMVLGLPMSESAAARSWLQVGERVEPQFAEKGNDVVILKRGGGNQPGPEIIDAPGHVGFFDRYEDDKVYLLSGNQNNEVNVSAYPKENILGVRVLT